MENFDDLKNLWNRQSTAGTTTSPGLITKAEATMKKLKLSQILTIVILAALTLTLIAYFIWIGAHRVNSLTIGLGVMIGVITIRILFEWASVARFKKIKPDSSMVEFGNRMSEYYSWRRNVNVVLVPIIYSAYTAGFTLLLPFFKDYFSHGMYLYIIISGYGSLIVLAIFIALQIRKELAILNLLKGI